jgi:Tfp pilus assembly protein PilX
MTYPAHRMPTGNRGVVLIITLLFAFLISAFVAIYYTIATAGIRSVERNGNTQRAYYAADAGLADAFMQLRNFGTAPPAAFNVAVNNFDVGPNLTATYNVAVASNGNQTWPTYTLTSVGNFNGVTKTLTLTVIANSITRWLYLSNSEFHQTWGRLYWGTGMISTGPVQTNGQLNIYGSPIFDGSVSQSASSIYYYTALPYSPDFRHGLTLSAPQIAFTGGAIVNAVSNMAQSAQGLLLTGDSTINLLQDGTMNVTNAQNGWNSTNVTLPANKAIFVQQGDVTVQGTVSGPLTIGSSNNAYISGHIVYKNNPILHPESTDVLGLVAQNNVTIKQNAPANLEVDGYIVSANASFQLENFLNVSNKGDMVQFGGLANYVCGPTGVFNSSGQLIRGYNQIMIYDERLKTMVPPGFPAVTDQFNRLSYAKVSLTES